MPSAAALAASLARELRAAGLPAPVSASTVFAAALGAVGLRHPERVHAAATATFLRRPEDREVFDGCFARWLGLEQKDRRAEQVPGLSETPTTPGVSGARWSAAELLRTKDLAACSPAEVAEVERAIRTLRIAVPRRRSRRRSPARSGDPDVRRTVRRALAHGGDPVRLERRRAGTRARRMVLLVDVSGSMEPYARALLHFGHAAVRARRGVEVFAIGTRLTRLSRELGAHDVDAALLAATTAMPDWAGGTRLGASLRAFNDRWGVPGLARGAVVVVLSDGWDRGDPAVLGAEMARLRRVAHRVLWVNPLTASAGYEPTAAGMAAALPHVDALLEGHSLGSLESLAVAVGGSR